MQLITTYHIGIHQIILVKKIVDILPVHLVLLLTEIRGPIYLLQQL